MQQATLTSRVGSSLYGFYSWVALLVSFGWICCAILFTRIPPPQLNKFHWHLTNDEGWRIQIPGLPELTDIGSRRCHDLAETSCLLPQLGGLCDGLLIITLVTHSGGTSLSDPVLSRPQGTARMTRAAGNTTQWRSTLPSSDMPTRATSRYTARSHAWCQFAQDSCSVLFLFPAGNTRD
jgi:hypothetical protein